MSETKVVTTSFEMDESDAEALKERLHKELEEEMETEDQDDPYAQSARSSRTLCFAQLYLAFII